MENIKNRLLIARTFTVFVSLAAIATAVFIILSLAEVDFHIEWNMFDSSLSTPLLIIGFIIGLGQKVGVWESIIVYKDSFGNITKVEKNHDLVDNIFASLIMPLITYLVIIPVAIAAMIYYPLMFLLDLFGQLFPFFISGFILSSIYLFYKLEHRFAFKTRPYWLIILPTLFIGIYWLFYFFWTANVWPLAIGVIGGLWLISILSAALLLRKERDGEVQLSDDDNYQRIYEKSFLSLKSIVIFSALFLLMSSVYTYKIISEESDRPIVSSPVVKTYIVHPNTKPIVYSGPGASYVKTTTLKPGDKISVMDIQKEWAHFSHKGATGYVSINDISEYKISQNKDAKSAKTADQQNTHPKKSTVESPKSRSVLNAPVAVKSTSQTAEKAADAVAPNVPEKSMATATKEMASKFSYGTFTDPRDGRTYKTIRIGSQIWLAENLAYLPKVSPSTAGANAGAEVGREPHYYVYGYKGTNVAEAKANPNYKKHGVLYNWGAAQQAIPQGWHLPSSDEWNQLANYIGSEKNELEKISNKSWKSIGKYLKAEHDWRAVSGYTRGDALNSYGLSMLPSGIKTSRGDFNKLDRAGAWWSSTNRDNTTVWGEELNLYNDNLIQEKEWLSLGLSIRCIQNQ
ncbi:FISUMP domain-containing protein [Mangrovibacterium marinum]|uniref:Uncharacterized protein (TIGR02145 family) n=1 Tax=Mangrovibacterium marinum TaxID=1639118 RepID=A0A2T5C0G7_9BACT|nr:FISUMP domain-containing protein [Mangrovibacterium marinum]PTN08089.1 uncharacterized protein (TIGR02145 family) [Mangrovibacterium marinum]